MRVYSELGEVLDRDAIVVGDGGDFVSYAGRFIDTYEPGCWMDPGPVRLPRRRARARRSAPSSPIPDRQVCLLLGDGAFGFAGMEFDTMARHGLGVVGVMGNNGIWALEHHPMKFLYGYSVAAELRPETRYDADGRGARLRRRRSSASRTSCGRRWSGPSSRAGRPWSTSSPTPRSSTRASRIWPEQASIGRPTAQNENRPPLLAADSSWSLRTGRGTSSGTSVFDGLRRREAP